MVNDGGEPESTGPEHADERHLAKLVEQFFDDNAEPLHQVALTSPLWGVARQIALDNLHRFVPDAAGDRSAFVAGMGACWFARRLAEQGWQVTLADISGKMIALYDEELEGFEHAAQIAIRKVDFCAMPEVRSRGYHAVLLVGGAVSDCGRPEAAFREADRIALPGAVLVASAKNKYASYTAGASKQHLQEMKALLREGARGWAGGYRPRFFSVEELIGQLSLHGIEVRRAISYPHFFHPGESAQGEAESLLDPGLMAEYLELEVRYAATPSLLGKGPILEVLGLKKLAGDEN